MEEKKSEEKKSEEKKKNDKKKKLWIITLLMILVVIFSIIAVYMHHTNETIIEETILVSFVAVFLVVIWRHAASEDVGREHISYTPKKKEENINNGQIKETTKVVDNLPNNLRKKPKNRIIPDYNIGLAEKHSHEEEISDELLKSIETDFSGKHALLVDDNDTNREIVAFTLSDLGFEVSVAKNGKEAVDMVKKSYYDVILMDVMMPVMNGYEATKEIRQIKNRKLSQIPIVALISRSTKEDIKKTKDAGMNGHITKPIDVTKLIKVLEKVMPV